MRDSIIPAPDTCTAALKQEELMTPDPTLFWPFPHRCRRHLWEQTHLAQVTEMCKLPPEAPLISNLGAFSPKKEEFTDEIFLVCTTFEALRSRGFLVRASEITCVTAGGCKTVLTQRICRCEDH